MVKRTPPDGGVVASAQIRSPQTLDDEQFPLKSRSMSASRLVSPLASVARALAITERLPGLRPPRYLASAIRTWPTMTSGIPFVNSRTLFLTQSAAFSFEASAWTVAYSTQVRREPLVRRVCFGVAAPTDRMTRLGAEQTG